MPGRQRGSKVLGPIGINKQLSLKRMEVRADGRLFALARLIPMTPLGVARETMSPAQGQACTKVYSLSIRVTDVWKGQPSTRSITEDPTRLSLVFLSPNVLWV